MKTVNIKESVRTESGEFNPNLFMASIEQAETQECLRLLGEILKLQTLHGLEHTKDKRLMDSYRQAWVKRNLELEKQSGTVRQQQSRSDVRERSKAGGLAAGSNGVSNGRRDRLLRGRVDGRKERQAVSSGPVQEERQTRFFPDHPEPDQQHERYE